MGKPITQVDSVVINEFLYQVMAMEARVERKEDEFSTRPLPASPTSKEEDWGKGEGVGRPR